jgi:hypothetical protein
MSQPERDETCSAPASHPKGFPVGCERRVGHLGPHIALLGDPDEYEWAAERETREPAPLRALVEKWRARPEHLSVIDTQGRFAYSIRRDCADELDAALSASAVSAPSYPCGHKVPRLCPFCNRLAAEAVSAPTPQGWEYCPCGFQPMSGHQLNQHRYHCKQSPTYHRAPGPRQEEP